MAAEIFLTDCKVSFIFKKFCEVEPILGNQSPKNAFLYWEWLDSPGIDAPVHSRWVVRRGSGMRVQFWEEEPSCAGCHVIVELFGRMWCIDTAACEQKMSLLKTKTKSTLPLELGMWSCHHSNHSETEHRLVATMDTKYSSYSLLEVIKIDVQGSQNVNKLWL